MNPLFEYMIYKNKWLWFHIMAGGFLAKILFLIFKNGQLAVDIVIALAILWELLEYLKNDIIKIYGNKKRFFLDSLGDIVGAVIMAIIVIL